MRVGLLLAVILGCLLAGALPAAAEGCPLSTTSIAGGAGTEGVVGVVERRTLARNPLPWGTSVSVATRIWGDILAERWVVSARSLVDCAARPPQPAGTMTYDFRGAQADWTGAHPEAWFDGPAPAAQLAILDDRFGPPTSFPVGSGDRVMAWLRVALTEVAVIAGALVAAVVATVRRRIRRRRDPHLF